MTDTMLERMARAICHASCGTPDALDADGAPRHWAQHIPEARAALEAMRQPGDKLERAFLRELASCGCPCCNAGAGNLPYMIDAILSEQA